MRATAGPSQNLSYDFHGDITTIAGQASTYDYTGRTTSSNAVSGPPIFGPFLSLVVSIISVGMEYIVAAAKTFKTEQIVAKLREASEVAGAGVEVSGVA